MTTYLEMTTVLGITNFSEMISLLKVTVSLAKVVTSAGNTYIKVARIEILILRVFVL